MKTLTESERWIVINGLVTARAKYEELSHLALSTRLSDQFALQAKQAQEMAEWFEAAGDIQLTEYRPNE